MQNICLREIEFHVCKLYLYFSCYIKSVNESRILNMKTNDRKNTEIGQTTSLRICS